jgi:di/tricarboxylate transporter
MSWQAWYTLTVVAACFGALSLTRAATDMVMIGGVMLLLVAGVLTPAEALAGLSNEGMVTIGMLYIVTSGVQETGAMTGILARLLGRPRSVGVAQLSLMAPVAAASAFLNNTPLVAMFIGAVSDWAKKNRIAPSKLMLPLSYAAVIGGSTTLIGTSTNLVVNGMLIKETGHASLGMFDIAVVGVPLAVAVIAFVWLTSRWLLPDRQSAVAQMENSRSYIVEMLVDADSPLLGRTIEEAGLRHLPGLFLMEIERGSNSLPAVSPQERLEARDRLIFTGLAESIVDLQKIRGLTPATDQVFKLRAAGERCLVEAVVSNSCPLVGRTVREGRFRTRYNAAVIAVARNGEQLRQKIGDVELRAGDTLMLLTHPAFVDQQRNSRDFYLVSTVENSQRPRHEKAGVALAIIAAMVVAVTLGWTSMLTASMMAAAAIVITGCTTSSTARRAVDWQVLLTIAAALAVGKALEKSGAAQHIADQITALGVGDPRLALVAVYVITVLFTELITNNAAAALMFPIAIATAHTIGVDFMPFVIAVLFAASASFATPIGYQTNLMVMGPGGYRFADYLRAGIPVSILVGIISLSLIPVFWHF